MDSFEKISTSVEQTLDIAREFAAGLSAGSIVALSGDLGAGKTHFVKGVASAFGIDSDTVSSPTFTIAHEYPGAVAVFHLDLYRIRDPNDLLRTGIADYLERGGICMIEWPEIAEAVLPAKTILIRLEHVGDERRKISCFPPVSR